MKTSFHAIRYALLIVAACGLLLPTAVLGRMPAQEIRVDVFGYYFIEEPVPAAFANIDHLHLSTINASGASAPLNGLIRLKRRGRARAVDFALVNPQLVGNKLTFKTRAVGGISYEFTGEFAQLGDFPSMRPEGVILKGSLTKMQGGRKVAGSDVSFRYEGGD